MFSPSNISGTTAMGGATGVASSVPGPKPVRRSLRDTLRYAADLAVAFATLADVETDAPSPRPPVDGTEVVPHPHRVPLRATARGGRPGAVVARPQSCLTPVDGRHAFGAPRAPKRRSRV
jgi:hypothetical protein